MAGNIKENQGQTNDNSKENENKVIGQSGPHASHTKKAKEEQKKVEQTQPKEQPTPQKQKNVGDSKLADMYQGESTQTNQTNQTNFSQEEMDKVKDLQKKYIEIQQAFGQVSVARIKLHQQLEALELAEEELTKTLKETQEDEKNFVDSITEKYGQGTLDPITGEYNQNQENN
jgi:ribonuclease HI